MLKTPLRISATAIDQFLRIGEMDFDAPDELFTAEKYIAEVKRGWVPTPAKTFGTAFGAIITEPEKRIGYEIINNEKVILYAYPFNPRDPNSHRFDFNQVELGINLMKNYLENYGAFWEIKSELKFGDVTVVCKCDGLTPNFVIENKTTSRFEKQNYIDSFQWRFYLLAFKVEFVRYHVFEFSTAKYREMKWHYEFEVRPYDEMLLDCQNVVENMAAFIYANNIESYFQPYEKR